MKRSTKRTVGLGSSVGISVTFVVLTFILIVSINTGSMMSLSGQQLVSNDVSDIAPQAGGNDCDAEMRDDGAIKIECDKNN